MVVTFNMETDVDLGSAAGLAVDGQATVELSQAFSNALDAEVPLPRAGDGAGVEAAAVVADGEADCAAVVFAGDPEARGVPVVDGVDKSAGTGPRETL